MTLLITASIAHILLRCAQEVYKRQNGEPSFVIFILSLASSAIVTYAALALLM